MIPDHVAHSMGVGKREGSLEKASGRGVLMKDIIGWRGIYIFGVASGA